MYSRLIFLSLLLLIFCGPARTQVVHGLNEATNLNLGGHNFISGTVFNPTGHPVNRRMGIRLVTEGKGEFVGTTDSYGQFIFGGLPAGSYLIYVDREDEFETVVQTVVITHNVEAFEGNLIKPTYNVALRLKDKINSRPKPAVVDSVSASAPKRSTEFYLKALELSKKGDHAGAIEQLELAVVEFPGFINAHNEMGVQYMKLNDLEKADEALLAALKIKPDSFEPLLNRGIVLLRQKRYAESEASLKSALTANASSAVAEYYLGRTLTALERFDEAERALLQSVTLSGDAMHEAHRMLANLYIARGNDARAIEELEKYLTLVPAASDAENLRKIIVQLKTPRPIGKPN